VRIVNGADMSDRAAAPGSLISVLNASVVAATPAQLNGGAASWPVIASSIGSSQLQVPSKPRREAFPLPCRARANSGPFRNGENAAPAIFVDAKDLP